MQNINYSAFDLASKLNANTRRGWSPFAILYIFLVPFFALLFIVLSSMFPAAMALIILGVAALVFIISTKKGKSLNDQIKIFANNNGWTTMTESPLLPVMAALRYKSKAAILSGSLDDLEFWLYRCEPPVWQGSGGNLEAVTFISVKFKNSFPTILLVPGLGMLGSVFDHVASSDFKLSRIDLEGDFSSKVRVYGREGEQVNVLEYITPDVMDVVLRNIKGIVLYDSEYLSISTSQVLDGGVIKSLFSDAQIMIKELREKTHSL